MKQIWLPLFSVLLYLMAIQLFHTQILCTTLIISLNLIEAPYDITITADKKWESPMEIEI